MPNLLLIAGNGRNVGKTFLARRIIEHLSNTNEVIGVKISPHFHDYETTEEFSKSEKYIILNESQNTSKDSSLLLKAGAKQVFFIMVKQHNLAEAFLQIQNLLKDKLVICESGGLHEIVSPGIFLFVKRSGEEIVKTQFLKYNPILVNNNGEDFDFNIHNIEFQNNTFQFKN